MNAELVPLLNTLQLNTRLFLSALDGVDAAIAVTRPNATTNFPSTAGSRSWVVSPSCWVTRPFIWARSRFSDVISASGP